MTLRCPNCGCDYKTAQELCDWKDKAALSTLDEQLPRYDQLEEKIEALREKEGPAYGYNKAIDDAIAVIRSAAPERKGVN